MGRTHAENIRKSRNAVVVALADADIDKAKTTALQIAEPDHRRVAIFDDYQKLLTAGLAEAILIVTPHPSHAEIAIAAFQAGLHVLCEKPIATRVSEAAKINTAAAEAGTVFGVVFHQRLDGRYRRLRRLIREGQLGRISRMHFITTEWFRAQSYYDSGAWRGTWAGEGGGVLMNQAPHDLDQICWQMGPAKRVTARCRTSDFHKIEVEDDAEALIDFASGSVGFFATATCELPGVNRMEVYGDRGLATCADGRLVFRQTNYSIRDFNLGRPERPESLTVADPVVLEPDEPEISEHMGITENFFRAIRTGEPLVAPGIEAIQSLELANAMVLSSELKRPVDLPLNPAAYDELVDRKTRGQVPSTQRQSRRWRGGQTNRDPVK
jgi:predicted dehydrogenase